MDANKIQEPQVIEDQLGDTATQPGIRKQYVAPQLTRFGTLENITLGNPGDGGDLGPFTGAAS